MNDDLDILRVHSGDDIRADGYNAMRDAIARRTLRGGKGVRVARRDNHRVISYKPIQSAVQPTAWNPTASYGQDGTLGLTFLAKGLVNGIEPFGSDGKTRITDAKCPPLAIQAFDPFLGDALVYVELTLDLSFQIKLVQVATYPTKPPGKPFTARKLLCIVNQDGSIPVRALFSFGFQSSNERPNGSFTQWWWALGGAA